MSCSCRIFRRSRAAHYSKNQPNKNARHIGRAAVRHFSQPTNDHRPAGQAVVVVVVVVVARFILDNYTRHRVQCQLFLKGPRAAKLDSGLGFQDISLWQWLARTSTRRHDTVEEMQHAEVH
jgi:hypothetical protein